MSNALPITAPPRRRTVTGTELHTASANAASAVAVASGTSASASSTLAPVSASTTISSVPHHFGGDSCKNTPNLSRKLDAYHQHMLDGGSHSATASPMPHRRLDKLEGCIRDKPSPLSLRHRRFEQQQQLPHAPKSSCGEHTHCGSGTQLHHLMSACHHHQQQQQLHSYQEQQQKQQHHHYHHNQHPHHHPLQMARHSEQMPSTVPHDSPLMRRRVDSDCGAFAGAQHQMPYQRNTVHAATAAPLSTGSSPLISRRQAVLGEPGCFSSPVHQRRRHVQQQHSDVGDGVASLPPSVFASPARSISSVVSTIADCMDGDVPESSCTSGGGIDEMMMQAAASSEMEQPLQASDQTVVSGWLKFRDNKRVCVKGYVLCYTIWLWHYVYVCSTRI